jgi:hypothetical protein
MMEKGLTKRLSGIQVVENMKPIHYKAVASSVRQFSTSVQVIYINCRDHIHQQLITSFAIRILRHRIPVILDITLNHCEHGVTCLQSAADRPSTPDVLQTARIANKQSCLP